MEEKKMDTLVSEKKEDKASENKDVEKTEGLEEAKPPFVVYGGEVSIEDEEYKAYYKTRYRFLTAMFKLVSKFDSKGRYIISEDVKRELLKMPKEIISSSENEYKAKNLFFGKEFVFKIELTSLEDGNAKATLFLEENVDKTLSPDQITSSIAQYVDKDDDEFRIKVRRVFNLVDVAMPLSEFEYPNLAVTMQNALDIDLVVGDLFDVASQMFLVRLLKLLEESEEGREILNKYKSLLNGDEDKYQRKYTYLRMLLERVIDEHGGYEKLGLDEKKKKQLANDLMLSIQNLKKKAQEQAGVMEVKGGEPQKKVEPKKNAPAKKPAKKPSKGGGKAKGGKDKKGGKGKKSKAKEVKITPIVFYIEEGGKEDIPEKDGNSKPEEKRIAGEDKNVIEKPENKEPPKEPEKEPVNQANTNSIEFDIEEFTDNKNKGEENGQDNPVLPEPTPNEPNKVQGEQNLYDNTIESLKNQMEDDLGLER